MKKSILLLHGYGFQRIFWDCVPFDDQKNSIYAYDFGFTGARSANSMINAQYDYIVGHSYGGLWAIQNGLRPKKGFIFINSFMHFPDLVPKAQIKALRNAITRDTNKAMERFHKNIGSDQWSASWDKDKLLGALEDLEQWDARPVMFDNQIPILVLLGKRDPLCLHQDMLEHWQEFDMRTHENGGHLLPLTHGDWCADIITQWMDEQ